MKTYYVKRHLMWNNIVCIYYYPIVIPRQYNKTRECERHMRQAKARWKKAVKGALTNDFEDISFTK